MWWLRAGVELVVGLSHVRGQKLRVRAPGPAVTQEKGAGAAHPRARRPSIAFVDVGFFLQLLQVDQDVLDAFC